MPSPTIPTTARGTVSGLDDATYGAWLMDALEHVPALTYPLSIQEYAVMRRDPTLAAVLAGYTLNVRRATWAVDGTGCRPEVVRHVADDMGLPVAGMDEPGPARLRGVSWEEHLRSALLCLTYGHSVHELLAEVRDGRAHLVMLAERMPHTITEIHVDPRTGALRGVSQDQLSRDGRPQIKADRLCFYSWEREGASWQGNSILRPAYGVHLLKREAQRVISTGVRRFSMGVPVVEWAPGSNPTPAQIAEAQMLASATRVGDQSGASLPPGATLKLVGLTGSSPDGPGWVEWLDRQQSRMALMPHLELGQGGNGGSRALGTAFIDSWTLALETLGSFVADQATRQIAARIVAWNEGEDEPVPRVVCSGIGSRREVTAESLDLLMRSGALSADPALEAWIRREFRLPEREPVSPPPPAPPAAVPAPVAASRPRRPRRREASGQLALPVAAAAEPEPDPAAIQEQWEAARAELLAQWPDAAQPMVDELAEQAEAAAEDDDLGALGTLVVSAAVVAGLAALIGAAGAATAALSAARVVAEAAAQGVTVALPDDAGADRARQAATVAAGLLASGYAAGAARSALQVAGPGVEPAVVGDAVRAHLHELGTTENGFVAGEVGAALSAAQAAGRTEVMATAEDAGHKITYRAVESNDPSRCGPCAEIHGTEFGSLAEARAAYPAGAFRSCEGRLRCRGYLFPVFGS